MKNITQLDGFLGIEWAESIVEAKHKFDNRAGVTLISELSNDNCLFYSGGSFAGQQVDLSFLQFSDKGFHTAKVVITEPLEARVIGRYLEVKNLIMEKYGDPDIDIYFYQPPYEEGDGYETTAISLGKGTVSAGWSFSVTDSQNNADSNYLGVEINEELKIVITYQNGILIQEVVDKQRNSFKNEL